MSIQLQSVPISNKLDFMVSLLSGGTVVATLTHGQAIVLTATFDSIGYGNSEPLTMFTGPAADDDVTPANLAYFEQAGLTIYLCYGAVRGGPVQRIAFTRD